MPPCPQSAASAPLLRPDSLPHDELDRDAGVDGDGHDQREKDENCWNDQVDNLSDTEELYKPANGVKFDLATLSSAPQRKYS